MKKLAALLLLMCAGAAFAQSPFVYFQTEENNEDNGYATPILVGGEWRDQAQMIFSRVNLSTWVSTGSVATFVSGTAHNLTAGDGILFQTLTSGATQYNNAICQVGTVTNSTTFTVTGTTCDSAPPYINSAGSGTFSSGQIWKKQGTNANPNGTWEIINTGTTNGKFMLRSNDKASYAGGTPCVPDQHTSTCYTTHPVLTGAFPIVYIEVDPSLTPTCAQVGTMQAGNLVLSSDIKFNLKFTSDQDGTTFGQRAYIVCEPGAGSGKLGIAKIEGGYEQVFTNEQIPVYGEVFGNADQYLIWSMTSDSGTGDATLETFTPPTDALIKNSGKLPQAVFHSGTVNTGYTIQACADADPTSCFPTRRYVSTASKPAGNADLVWFSPCEVDPVMAAAGGTTYDIGPGQTYADWNTVPVGNYPWGSTFIFHGETGGTVSLANYFQIDRPNNSASFASNMTVPSFYICGKPNPTTGALPILEAINATNLGPCDFNLCRGIHSLITVNGTPASIPPVDNYNGNPNIMHQWTISNIKLQNASGTNRRYDPGQVPPSGTTTAWPTGHGIRTYATENYTIKGMRMDLDNDGILTDCNSSSGWVRNCSSYSRLYGSHLSGYGTPGFPTEHAAYMQDNSTVLDFNIFDGSVSDQATGMFSMRSNHALIFGNRAVVQSPYWMPNGFGGNTELQDSVYYYDINASFGPTAFWTGGTSCSDGTSNYPFCTPGGGGSPALGGLSTWASFAQKHWIGTFLAGNLLVSGSGGSAGAMGCNISISQNHGDNGMEMQHNLNASYNLVHCPQAEAQLSGYWYEDVRPKGSAVYGFSISPRDFPQAHFRNNVYWWNSNVPSAGFRSKFGARASAHGIFATNVVHVGQFDPTQTNIPLLYGNNGFNGSAYGIYQFLQEDQFTGMYGGEAKLGGWTPSNFIAPASRPYDLTLFHPTVGSASIGAASALPYPASLYPPMFNAVEANGTVTRRTDLTTIGPFDSGSPVVTTGFSLPAGSKLGHNSVMR